MYTRHTFVGKVNDLWAGSKQSHAEEAVRLTGTEKLGPVGQALQILD